MIEAYRPTRPKQIIAQDLSNFGHVVPYQQAYRAKGLVLDGNEGDEAKQFNLLNDLLDRANSHGYIANCGLEGDLFVSGPGEESIKKHVSRPQDPNMMLAERTFLSYTVFPGISFSAYSELRPFIVVDGCHIKSRYGLILLTAVALDGNNNLLPLAWGVVWSETEDNWIRFLSLVRRNLIEVENDYSGKQVIMSDRQKGLIPAIAKA